ncbi:hypothetical protein EYF80_005984 [Liparis tanakae]|uniref:Uncharacterized protein n=1 Tax=Liparis tanakae TaxID=230148 RepID=A0A4Z2J274_9TELE|nr:hypothetical protein EYF80_005984 [Liparis tanakae]
MQVIHSAVPTWFMNEQPAGSRDQPTSSTTNQPLALFQSKCVHCAHFAPLRTESSCSSATCFEQQQQKAGCRRPMLLCFWGNGEPINLLPRELREQHSHLSTLVTRCHLSLPAHRNIQADNAPCILNI